MLMRHIPGAVALFAALALSAPGTAFADKGGKPSLNGIDHGRGANHAHDKGRATDPHPDRGNDSPCDGDGGACGEG